MLKPIKNIKKTEQLKKQLVELVKKLEPGERLPSVRRLNEELKISTSTIDRVLFELSEEGVIKRKHGKGIFANPDFCKTKLGIFIGMDIFEEGISQFYRNLVKELKTYADENNFVISIFFESHLTENQREKEKTKLQNQTLFDGVIVINGRDNELYKVFQKNNIPIVGHACKFPVPYSVEIDNEHLVISGIEALAQAGCKRIAAIVAIENNSFKKIIEKHSVKKNIDENLIWEYTFFSKNEYSASNERWEKIGYRAAKDLLSKNEIFDGLLITDDMISKGALSALQEDGLYGNNNPIKIAAQSNKGSDTLWQYENRLIRMEIDPSKVAEGIMAKLSKLLGVTKDNSLEKTTFIKSNIIMN